MAANDDDEQVPIEPLLTIADLATMLRRSARTIRYWRAQGALPRPDVDRGRTTLWRRATIERWLDEGSDRER